MHSGTSEVLRDTLNADETRHENSSKTEVLHDSSVSLGMQKKAEGVVVHPQRYQYTLLNESLSKNEKTDEKDENTEVVPWSNVGVEITEPPLQCFICGTHEDGNPLRSCGGHQSGIKGLKKHQCSSMFHLGCLKNYNASGCKSDETEQEKNKLMCPLHCCNACFGGGKVQTLFNGKMIECAACYRSFHVDCEPCGALRVIWMMEDDDNKVPVNMLICPSHAELSKPRKHLPVCYKCEKTNGTLEKCKKCIRSFHKECSTIATVNKEPNDKIVCGFCLNQETLPIGSPVIALYKKEWIVGYPEVWSAVTHLNMRKYTVGDVIVRREDDSNRKIVPVNRVIQFSDGAKEFLAKYSASELNKPPLYKDVKKHISTSKYSDPKLRQFLEAEDVFDCDCKDMPNTDGIRCGDACQNRASQLECPPECAERPGGCANRKISEKYVCENIERRPTEKKGFGVFALADIKKGEFIAEYAGEIITGDDANKRIQLAGESKDFQTQLYMMQLRPNRIVDAATKGNIARYINHSCSPNCQPRVVRIVVVKSFGNQVKYDERVGIRAIRNISKGEEITFEYEVLTDGSEPPECFCESENCTGIIGKVAEKDDKPVKQKMEPAKKRGRKIEPESEDDLPSPPTTTVPSRRGRKSRKKSKSLPQATTSAPRISKSKKNTVQRSPTPVSSDELSKSDLEATKELFEFYPRACRVREVRHDSRSPTPDTKCKPSTSKSGEKTQKEKPRTAENKKTEEKVMSGGHAYSPYRITSSMPGLTEAEKKKVFTFPFAKPGDPEPKEAYFAYYPDHFKPTHSTSDPTTERDPS